MSDKLVFVLGDETKAAVDHTTLDKDASVVLLKDGKEFQTKAGGLKLAASKTKEERIAHLSEHEELSASQLAQIEALKLKATTRKK